jgi:radical SAM protein with 4Fe4S-binding SPASM domain
MIALPVVPRCHMPWQQVVIDAAGMVNPCAYRNNYQNMSAVQPCGDINKAPLTEIWNSDEFQRLRANMAKGDLEAAGCANCLALKQGQALGLQADPDADAESPPTSAYARNMAIKREEVAAGAAVLKSLPSVVHFTPTHKCNLRCVHCYQDFTRALTLTRRDAETDVLALLPILDRIVAGGGEPLLLPVWQRFVREMSLEANPYLEFAATTNATRISPEMFEGLNRFKRLALTVSLDGASADVFERIRIKGRFADVVQNLDKLRRLAADHPRADVSVTFSVMKFNILGLPDLVRFCAGRQLGYNLLPVVCYPVDQSLRCFTDPAAQMAGWRESIAEARRLLDDVYLPIVPFGERSGDLYRGHLAALEGLIPWAKLDTPHHRIRRRVPPAVLQMYHQAPTAGHLSVGFFPLRDGAAGEVEYYAEVHDGRYEVCLPEGPFLAVLFPRNLSPTPGMKCRWRAAVAADGTFRESGAPARTRLPWLVKKWGRRVKEGLTRSWHGRRAA